MQFLLAVLLIAGLTFLLASLLVTADRLLHVPTDPRVERVERLLPHTNCGGCGQPGCHAFAESLVAGQAVPAQCTVATATQHQRIADELGVEVGQAIRRVARLACAGGDNVARNRAHYEGTRTCAAAALVAGGGKACFWGCLGWGDCQRACDFDAIKMNPHRLPVVAEDLCTGCGDCVQACPKDLFSLHAVTERLWVACSSLAHGDEVLDDCEVACTACGRCAMDSAGYIEMHNGLPVIDHGRGPVTDKPIQRCPTGAIVWIDSNGDRIRGREARPLAREDVIRELPT